MTDPQTGPLYLGIDVGGTNIKAGIVTDEGNVIAQASVPTEAAQGPDNGVGQMAQASQQALKRGSLTIDQISAVGLATPGTMDIPAGLLLDPPNLPGWNDYPVRQKVSDVLGRPTILQNDANAAAYGEYWAGSASNADSLVFFTLGTGLGGGLIVDDTIVQGEHSHGSELGHTIIEMDNGRLCKTGQYGTLEAYCSATALIERFHEAMKAGRSSSVSDRMDDVTALSPLLMAEEAEKGDELAIELILEMARCLGAATTSIVHVIDPTMVLLGGAMTFGRHETRIGRDFLSRVRDEFRRRAFPVLAEQVTIDYAELGGNAGFIGAAGCARRAVIRGLI
ncbi:MAG: ROK family protein [Fuerstiella sp.]|nr:ROK family protein [Fuerstiella sp.]MCP4856597.1 ROK family protein [Fuerstiella sp.]